MKKFLALLAFVATSVAALAVPANSEMTRVVKMSDGRQMTIMLRGDETFHFFVTTDGMVVREQADGTWVQDTRDVHALWTAEFRKRNSQRIQNAERVRRAMRAPSRIGNSNNTTGKKRGLLILVNFQNLAMQEESTREVFNQMLNDVETPYGENHGSVRKYFQDQSYGQFDVEFDVVGPVTVSKNMEYYGGNNSSKKDSHPEEMISEACQLADEEFDVDFSLYDWDGDGEVENIYVTYAGKGEADGGESNTIWPHQWDLYSAYKTNSGTNYELFLDDVKINTYACGAELNGNGNISGIGTMCHEYSHCLGIPDFYDTSGNNNLDMLNWSLMSSGNYNGNGFCPAGYTAYERMFCGWLEPKELASSTTIGNIPPIEDEPVAYIVYNDNNRDEYFLLANHQQKGWDTKAKGHGMMILHVTYDKDAWTSNKVNVESGYQRMVIIPAGGSFHTSGDRIISSSDDLWPGTSNNTALTDASTPAAQLHYPNTDGKYFMHKPIEDITELGEYISFRFMGGVEIDAPTLDEAADISDHSFRAKWTPTPAVTSYNLMLTEKGKKNDAALDALKLVEYFDNPNQLGNDGWTWSGLASSNINGVRVSNYITTPLITDNTSGQISIIFTAKPVSGSSQVILYILNKNGKELTSNGKVIAQTYTLNQNTTHTIKFALRGSIPDYKIKLSTNSSGTPFYLMKFYAFDGDASTEDVTALETPAEDKTTHFIGITSPEYVFTGLLPDYDYKVRVQAIDADSQISAWSDEISVHTLLSSAFAKGDINEDDELNDSDVSDIVNIITGKHSGSIDFRTADVNGDGRITIADLTLLVNLIIVK